MTSCQVTRDVPVACEICVRLSAGEAVEAGASHLALLSGSLSATRAAFRRDLPPRVAWGAVKCRVLG